MLLRLSLIHISARHRKGSRLFGRNPYCRRRLSGSKDRMLHSLPRAWSVSYTHLDVYKRQFRGRVREVGQRLLEHYGGSCQCRKYLFIVHRSLSVAFGNPFHDGDVYKRQVLETESGDFRLAPAYDLINTKLHVDEMCIRDSRWAVPIRTLRRRNSPLRSRSLST